jgi:hypothetical protein
MQADSKKTQTQQENEALRQMCRLKGHKLSRCCMPVATRLIKVQGYPLLQLG